MSYLVLGIATWKWSRKGKSWNECIQSWQETASRNLSEKTIENRGIMEAYQAIYESFPEAMIAYIHDDVIIHERGWDARIMREFEDPQVGIVGFAGAPGLGHPQMYAPGVQYHHQLLGRVGFMSNLRNAEIHGRRFNGERDVAVLDGLGIIVRREVLERAGGWPLGTPIGYFMYDAWICCMARRLGYKVRLVGIDCDHLGGRSTGLNPKVTADEYEPAHRYIYDEFRDVLPAMVGEL